MPDLTIYQAVSNGYDNPKPVKSLPPGVDFQLTVASVTCSGALWNRYHKIKAPPSYRDRSLYLDGNITPKPSTDIVAFVENALHDADIAFFKHPQRTCAYAEIEACVALKKITKAQGDHAFAYLKAMDFPRRFGLWACGIIVRRSGVPWVQKFQDLWWDLCKIVPRDQLWMAPALWSTAGARPAQRLKTIDLDIWKNPFFDWTPHPKKA